VAGLLNLAKRNFIDYKLEERNMRRAIEDEKYLRLLDKERQNICIIQILCKYILIYIKGK
jgi:hypothetical protein